MPFEFKSEPIIKAFVAHFQLSVPVVYEGELPTSGHKLWVEFRRLGPHLSTHGRVTLVLDFAVMEELTHSNNIYNSDKIIDEIIALCTPVMVGTQCFEVQDNIRITPWGRLGIDSLVKQTTVEVSYGSN